MNYIDRALQVAISLYDGRIDKSGRPEILHPLSVAMNFKNQEKLFVCALLHDVIEDRLMTDIQLRLIFPDDYVDTILVLTRKEGQTYKEYIQSIIDSDDHDALEIKYFDLEDNIGRNEGKFPDLLKRHWCAKLQIASVL